MIRTLADSVAAALRGGTEALQHRCLVYEYSAYEELAALCLTLILLFPVGDGAAQKFLYLA